MTIYMYRIDVFEPLDTQKPGAPSLPDLKDFEVEASDGHIGKVDKASQADGSSYLIVDTGFWIFGKKS